MHLYNIPLSRPMRQALMIAADSVLLVLAVAFAFTLLGEGYLGRDRGFYPYLVGAIGLSIAYFLHIGLYRDLVLYMGLQSALKILHGASVAALLLALACVLGRPGGTDYALLPLFWMISLILIGGLRFVGKLLLRELIHNFRPKEPVIIYGAGESGMQLVVALQSGNQYLPVAFVDDAKRIIGSSLHGVRVFPPGRLEDLVTRHSARQILLAIPSASHAQRKKILNRLEHLPVHVKTVPDMYDLVAGLPVDRVGDIDIEDLLGRDTVFADPRLLGACIKGRTVMVTGAGGSIGSELCRQIIGSGPARLILLDSSEYGLYKIEEELQETRKKLQELAASEEEGDSSEAAAAVEIIALLGSVCNRTLMGDAMAGLGVDTVYHVAAYKQVPMVEKNVVEGVYNNIIGTLVAAEAAEASGVSDFVLISTDKAVRPKNYMGATKRFAEQVLQAMARRGGGTKFSMVRFGNVLGSSGSVVPLFRRQIRDGGPVTVTHPEVSRYFMTVQEAAQLVIQAGSMAKGGDVFVLDMHEPVRIVDLAKKMIHLMGCAVKNDETSAGIAIEYTGLRAGEKLHEELMIGESVTGTEHPKIMRAEEDSLSWQDLQPLLARLKRACERPDLEAIRIVLQEAVDGFAPADSSDPLQNGRQRAEPAEVTPLFKQQ